MQNAIRAATVTERSKRSKVQRAEFKVQSEDKEAEHSALCVLHSALCVLLSALNAAIAALMSEIAASSFCAGGNRSGKAAELGFFAALGVRWIVVLFLFADVFVLLVLLFLLVFMEKTFIIQAVEVESGR